MEDKIRLLEEDIKILNTKCRILSKFLHNVLMMHQLEDSLEKDAIVEKTIKTLLDVEF